MLKKTIKYENFNGDDVETTHYFNLSKSELYEMETGEEGGSLAHLIQQVMEDGNPGTAIQQFKRFILMSYGKKSLDGESFEKSDELRHAFSQTAAYNALFLELSEDAGAAGQFLVGCMPKEMAQNVEEVSKFMEENPEVSMEDASRMVEERKNPSAIERPATPPQPQTSPTQGVNVGGGQ